MPVLCATVSVCTISCEKGVEQRTAPKGMSSLELAFVNGYLRVFLFDIDCKRSTGLLDGRLVGLSHRFYRRHGWVGFDAQQAFTVSFQDYCFTQMYRKYRCGKTREKVDRVEHYLHREYDQVFFTQYSKDEVAYFAAPCMASSPVLYKRGY